MEILSYFPSEIRGVILSFIPWTLSELEEHRSCSTVSHLLDSSVTHLILRKRTKAKHLFRFPNLKIVVGDIMIHDHADLSLLNRLREYEVTLNYCDLVFTEFFRSVSTDHFKRGCKRFFSDDYQLYFSNGHFMFWIDDKDNFRKDLQILIERQLFDGITIDDDDLTQFNNLLNSIKGLRRVTISPPFNLLPNNIWTQVEEIDFIGEAYGTPEKLLKMFREYYRELPNIKLFNYLLSDADRNLFPNLRV